MLNDEVAVINEGESKCKITLAASFKVKFRHFTRGTEDDKGNKSFWVINILDETGSVHVLSSSTQPFFVQCYTRTLLYSMPVR